MLSSLCTSGKTALHWAASMNMMEIMKILLKQGANKDSQDNNVSGIRLDWVCLYVVGMCLGRCVCVRYIRMYVLCTVLIKDR